MQLNKECIVIGAGIAGLSAARTLSAAGRSVLVLESAASVGGRVSTHRRRLHNGRTAVFDAGAQFVYSIDPEFQEVVRKWHSDGLLREWSEASTLDRHPEIVRVHVGIKGMQALPQSMADSIDVRCDAQVEALTLHRDGYCVLTLADDTVLRAADVIVTCPAPQAVDLFERGEFPLPSEQRAYLDAVDYSRCLAVLAVLDRPSALAPPGVLNLSTGPLASICDQGQKGVSSEVPTVTLLAQPAWSYRHWDSNETIVAGILLAVADEWLGAEVLEHEVVHWGYAEAESRYPASCMVLHNTPTVVLAGDLFGPGRIEGAYLSGRAAARMVLGAGDK